MQLVKYFAILMMLVALGNLLKIEEEEETLSKEDKNFLQSLDEEEESHHLNLAETSDSEETSRGSSRRIRRFMKPRGSKSIARKVKAKACKNANKVASYSSHASHKKITRKRKN